MKRERAQQGISDFRYFRFESLLQKPPTSVGGSLSSAYALWVTIVRSRPLLYRGATRGASGAAVEEQKSAEGKRGDVRR